MSIVNPVIYYVPIRHLATAIVAFRSNYLPAYKALYLRAYKAPVIYVPIRHLYICRERSTNQLLFMQNKPNFQDTQMNVSIYYTKVYKNETAFRRGKNKPNSNPIKPNLPEGKIDAKCVFTKDYRKKDDFAVQKNKPNSNPIPETPKMNANSFITKDYRKNDALAVQKNKPKQTQGIKRVRSIFRRFILAFLTQAPHINITAPIFSSNTRICPQNQKKT